MMYYVTGIVIGLALIALCKRLDMRQHGYPDSVILGLTIFTWPVFLFLLVLTLLITAISATLEFLVGLVNK